MSLTVIIKDPNSSGSTSSIALSSTIFNLETATISQSNICLITVNRNIISNLSNYCKALFNLINIIINNSEECWNSESLKARSCCSRNSDIPRAISKISTLQDKNRKPSFSFHGHLRTACILLITNQLHSTDISVWMSNERVDISST